MLTPVAPAAHSITLITLPIYISLCNCYKTDTRLRLADSDLQQQLTPCSLGDTLADRQTHTITTLRLSHQGEVKITGVLQYKATLN